MSLSQLLDKFMTILISLFKWADKRVLYMTPQTLVNDLASGLADPLDIILIVIGM